MNTILTRRGEEEKRRSSMKRGLKVMRMWPLGLRFFLVSTFLYSSSCESSRHVSPEKVKRIKKEKEKLPFRPLILSISNFECEQKKKKI